MSETQQSRRPDRPAARSAPPSPQHRGEAPPQVTGWVGWIVFAAVVMFMGGAFQVVAGVTALLRSDFYVATDRLLVNVDYTAWGWVHIGVGAVAVAAAVGLLGGHLWGRVLAICVAGLSALVNMAFLAAYPLWALLVIALDVVVIYAVAVHGQELEDRS